jgi:hypothetical protein
MKKVLLLCSVSIILLCAGVASAKKSPYPNIMMARGWSALPASAAPASNRDYKNISDAARWSSLARPLTPGSTRKSARATQGQDPTFDASLLFDDTFSSTWKGCVKTCVGSALAGTGTLCLTNCTACALTGAPWSCAICASCGVVGFVAVEFCTLHCCVNPGCPASDEFN